MGYNHYHTGNNNDNNENNNNNKIVTDHFSTARLNVFTVTMVTTRNLFRIPKYCYRWMLS